MSHSNTLDVDSIIERLLSVRGQPNNRTVQLAEGEIRALCASARGTVEFEFVFFFCFRPAPFKRQGAKVDSRTMFAAKNFETERA